MWGGGAPSPLRERSGEGAVRTTSTEKKIRIWISKWRLLENSGDKFASFSSRRLNLIL